MHRHLYYDQVAELPFSHALKSFQEAHSHTMYTKAEKQQNKVNLKYNQLTVIHCATVRSVSLLKSRFLSRARGPSASTALHL